MAKTKSKPGRRKGGRNRGYFYRAGRGWYAVDAGQMYPLHDSNGTPLKSKSLRESVVREARARWLHEHKKQLSATKAKKRAAKRNVTLLEVCQRYLANAKATGASKTYEDRADTLFDFCFGLPPQFRTKSTSSKAPLSETRKRELAKNKIHDGYGSFSVDELLPLHIDEWLNAHTNWKGGRRTRIQAVKRALNYAAEAGLIERNPIRGYRTPKVKTRVTYISPEQEEALLELANWHFKRALYVCIRTGARPGSEFAALKAKHITDLGDRMEWKFSADEIKTRRQRIIRITDPKVIEIVRYQLKHRRRGHVFRNTLDKPWTRESLSLAFRSLKRRLKKTKRIELDADACMYSTRHTYAKRTLQGYWTGRATNIETLARLMGNSPQICREHYLQWSEIDNDPLWDAA